MIDFVRHSLRGRRFEVNASAVNWSGDDLHGAVRVVAPTRDWDASVLTAFQRKEFGVPAVQAVHGQRVRELLGGVQRHGVSSIGARVFGPKPPFGQPKTPSD